MNGGGYERFTEPSRIFGAADEKVPLLMVCVKPKPQHLVFQMVKGESRFIIPGICLWRMAGGRIRSGFGGDRGPVQEAGFSRVFRGIFLPLHEATRRGCGSQGAEMVQFRWMGVGGVENGPEMECQWRSANPVGDGRAVSRPQAPATRASKGGQCGRLRRSCSDK